MQLDPATHIHKSIDFSYVGFSMPLDEDRGMEKTRRNELVASVDPCENIPEAPPRSHLQWQRFQRLESVLPHEKSNKLVVSRNKNKNTWRPGDQLRAYLRRREARVVIYP